MLTACLLPARCCILSRCCLLVQYILLIALFALPGVMAAQVGQSNDITKFRLRDGYLIIVQTMVNGAGPFTFLLDTGTTRTVIDPSLARQLRAPVIGEASLTTVLHVRQDKLVRLNEVQVGDAVVSDLGAMVDNLTRIKIEAPGIRGVLGEDFLSSFDLLIDYKERSLRFGGPAPAGERCRFETMGQYHGLSTSNRLLIEVKFMEVSGDNVQLQLDTGAKNLEMFPVRQNSFPSQPWGGAMAASSGVNGTTIYSSITLKIGATIIRDLDIVQSRRAIAFDAVGLLPAAIFHKIYISHSGGYVILNPTE